MIRVGRCVYDKQGQRTDPSFQNYKNIVVLMKSHSRYGGLGPYYLKNESGQIFENWYQAHKIYETVPKTVQRYSRWDQTIIWDHPEEIHWIDGSPTDEYWLWREKLMNNKYHVRYPVGFNHRSKCRSSIYIIDDELKVFDELTYIEARKKFYVEEYVRLVKKQALFYELKKMLQKGDNLLIIEVDGPHGEDIDYYKAKYNTADDFIENNTMLVNKENINIMLNDTKHPFGHGYCLAMALLDISFD